MKPDDINVIPVIVYDRSQSKMTKRNTVIIYVCAITILLFASSSALNFVFGDIGIISLCFLTVMFGSGMLTEVDFNSLSWHTLFLVGGGTVLGKAVGSSGLLEYLADGITKCNIANALSPFSSNSHVSFVSLLLPTSYCSASTSKSLVGRCVHLFLCRDSFHVCLTHRGFDYSYAHLVTDRSYPGYSRGGRGGIRLCRCSSSTITANPY